MAASHSRSKASRSRPRRRKANRKAAAPKPPPSTLAAPWLFGAVITAYAGLVLPGAISRRAMPWEALIPLGIFCGTLVLALLLLRLADFRGDNALLGYAFFLAGLGMVTQFRLGNQAVADWHTPASYVLPADFAAYLTACLVFAHARHRMLRPLWFPCLVLACGVIALVLVFGRRYRGAVFLPGHVNPVEVAKLLLVIFLAGFLTPHRKALEQTVGGMPVPGAGFLSTFLIFWGAPMVLLVLQRDLGMIVLLNGVLMLMLFVLSERRGYLVWAALLIAALCAAAFFLTSHSQSRFIAWLAPFRDPTGASWQVLQGLAAMYTGGIWGSGLGAGDPGAIPIASSDLVYAAIGEELGFIGCGMVVLAWLGLLSRGFRIATAQKDDYTRLLACGLTTVLGLQALLNIGGVVKFLPLTGITLPFISHGGSSLVTSFAIVGLLAALSTGNKPKRAKRR